jgi:hypothetical protein
MNPLPRFANKQTSVLALGLAVLTVPNQAPAACYFSAAGAGVALKSLWASSVSNNSTGFYCTPWHTHYLQATAQMKSFYAALPNSSVQHLVAVRHHPHFFIAADPMATAVTDEAERQHLLDQLFAEQVLPGFGLWLNDRTNVPVLDAWLPTIWSAAMDPQHPAHELGLSLPSSAAKGEANGAEPAIHTAVCYGDCLSAWELNPAYNWLRLVQWLLKETELTF